MPKPFTEKTGNRNERIAIDSERIMSALSQGDFDLSTSASTYNPEEYTISYIESIFKAITDIEKSWNNCKNTAGKYIADFEDVPLPEDIPPVTDSFDDDFSSGGTTLSTSDETLSTMTGLGMASVTATSLKIRKDPNTDSKVLGYCSNNDKYEIVGYSDDGKWVKVKLKDGTTGYLSKKYVDVTENTNQESSTTTTETEILDQSSETKDESLDSDNSQQSLTQGQVKTNGGNLNIRDENMNVIGSLKNNSDVKILGKIKIDDKEWYEIDLGNGKTGRVSKDYIDTAGSVTPTDNYSIPTNVSSKGIVNTTTGNLRVRRGPSLNSEVVGYLPRNEEVEILEYNENENWAKILYNGESMYVYKDKIKLKGD